MKQLFISIIILFILFISSFINAQETALLVKFKNENLRQSFASDSRNFINLRSISKTIELVPSFPHAKTHELNLYYDIRTQGNANEMINALQAENIFSEVKAYEMSYPMTNPGCVATNDSIFTDGSDYTIELIQADCAWLITKGSKNIVIGITEVNFQETHEDLCNQILSVSGPVSTNPSEHGTLVSGIACAEPNNGKGIKGVGYNTKFKGFRILSTLNPSSNVYEVSGVDIKDAVWNAYLDGCRVINVSWSSTGFYSYNILGMIEITNSGVVVTVSAGNSPTDLYHSDIAHIPGVICVSGVDSDNNYYPGYARNQYVDLCAPSRTMQTTSALLKYRISWGTSFAAPCVAGAAALVLAANSELTAAQVENILKNTAAPINNASSYSGIGTGRLDVYAAVQAACVNSLTNKTITSNKSFAGCNSLNVQNVTVSNSARLTLDAAGDVTISSDFEVISGSELEIK